MNKIIVNPNKFQAIVLNMKPPNHTNINSQVDNQVIKSVSSVEHLFKYMTSLILIYTSAAEFINLQLKSANELNALLRLKVFLSFHAKEVLINSYIISKFNYCPLVWVFSSAQSINKI